MLLINSPVHSIMNILLSRSCSLGLLCGGFTVVVWCMNTYCRPLKINFLPQTHLYPLCWRLIPLRVHFNIIVPSTLNLPEWFFHYCLPNKNSVEFSSSPYVLHDQPEFFFTWSPEQFPCVAVITDTVTQRLEGDSYWLVLDSNAFWAINKKWVSSKLTSSYAI